jgi:hypothetical protein
MAVGNKGPSNWIGIPQCGTLLGAGSSGIYPAKPFHTTRQFNSRHWSSTDFLTTNQRHIGVRPLEDIHQASAFMQCLHTKTLVLPTSEFYTLPEEGVSD